MASFAPSLASNAEPEWPENSIVTALKEPFLIVGQRKT
jgi:hypothetical protein